ncbi:MAG: hypothetical protein J0H38_07090 [Rhizobiales bacterium]|nr:hypothetical protein [Hyphomicrobiales bacterium]
MSSEAIQVFDLSVHFSVMAGLVPAIHVFGALMLKDVDARHKAGHDDRWV